MVNSASQALAEFKSQRLGGLLSGTSSTVSAPSIVGTSLMDSASDRMARSAPKRSSSAFMDNIRKSGQNYHQTALAGIQAKQAVFSAPAPGSVGGPARGSSQYALPNKGASYNGKNGQLGPKGGGGDYGLTVPASNALRGLNAAYSKQFGSGLSINDGYRDLAGQQKAWQDYQNGGNKAAEPGTSVHGWGQAVDLGGPIQNSGSAQHAWLRSNAAQLKWYWVGQRFGEPWHWEYHPEW